MTRPAAPGFLSRVPAHAAALGVICALMGAFELIVRAGFVHSFLLPPPSAVLASLPALVLHEGLLGRVAATVAQTLAGAAIAITVGTVLGWALYRFRDARRAFTTWVVGLGAAPLLLLYPLFLIFFGRGHGTVVAMSAVAGLAPITLKTLEGLSSTPRVLLNVGRSFRLSPAALFWRVRVPAALPVVFVGIRLGLAYSLIGVVSTQYLTNFGGLGELVTDLADRYLMASMFGAVLFITLTGAAFITCLDGVQRWLRPH